MTFPPLLMNRNKLLSALPADEYLELQANLDSVKMRRGEIIYKSGEPVKYVYFPESCIVSMITVFDDGTSVESGMVGREGMTGTGVLLSNTISSRDTFVQTTGRGWRMQTEKFQKAVDQCHHLHKLVKNYASVFFEQVAQAGACSNHHSLSERLARLLLMCHDRLEGDEIKMTQDFLAQMLGAYRPNITKAAVILKEQKLIDYERGLIKILDKKGLEKMACECYEAINECYRQYLSSLEIHILNQRADQTHQAMELVLKRKQEILRETNIHLKNLQAAADSIKTMAGEFLLCPNCHQVRDEHGCWRLINSFVNKRFNVTINRELCPECRKY